MEENTRGMVFDDSFDTNLVDEGDYEVILKAEKKTVGTSGKEKLSLDFKIRADVDQKFKNKHVFDDAWQDKDNPFWFDLIKLNKLIKTQKGLPNYKIDFKNVDECILFLNGIACIITVTKEFDEYSGQDRNRVKYLSYRPSNHPVVATPAPAAEPAPADELPTDDLPF